MNLSASVIRGHRWIILRYGKKVPICRYCRCRFKYGHILNLADAVERLVIFVIFFFHLLLVQRVLVVSLIRHLLNVGLHEHLLLSRHVGSNHQTAMADSEWSSVFQDTSIPVKATTGGLCSSSPPITQTLCHWSNYITNIWGCLGVVSLSAKLRRPPLNIPIGL